mmetsp:Transcript_9758/g.14714  ORF Transcript_9758/g.14714 Transcript_9758/m.14714 type:complete len:440 (+) Transcript_9758:79-1398(+)
MTDTEIVVKEMRVTTGEFGNFVIDLGPMGKGRFGVVHRAVRKSDNKTFSLKFFGYMDGKPQLAEINSEIMFMMALVGVEGAVQIESIFYDLPEGFLPNKNPKFLQSYPVIVMEAVGGGDLFMRIKNRVENKEKISERYLASMFSSTMSALDSFHRRKFIHRDLKTQNLLLVSDAQDSPVKIIDFGSMVQLNTVTDVHTDNRMVGTKGCFAPESITRFEYSVKSDIWQAGCLLFCMILGRPPFFADRWTDIKAGEFIKCSNWNHLSEDVKDLITRMLTVDPAKRISMSDIRSHRWLSYASDADLGGDYAKRVKSLALRQELCRLLNRSCELNSEESPNMSLQSFALFDENGDGFVTRRAFRNGVSRLLNAGTSDGKFSPRCARLCPTVHTDVDEMFDVIDTNGDGKIEYVEFQEFYHVVLSNTNSMREKKRKLDSVDASS